MCCSEPLSWQASPFCLGISHLVVARHLEVKRFVHLNVLVVHILPLLPLNTFADGLTNCMVLPHPRAETSIYCHPHSWCRQRCAAYLLLLLAASAHLLPARTTASGQSSVNLVCDLTRFLRLFRITMIRWWEGLLAPQVTKWQQGYHVGWDATDGPNGGAERTVWETSLDRKNRLPCGRKETKERPH